MNLPNKLTILRLFLAFVFMYFLFLEGILAKSLAILVFTCACLTDLYDGRIARGRNLVTNFGKIMDPIADKILVLSAFLSFVELKLIPAWMAIVILSRELLITGLRLFAISNKVILPAGRAGKHKTFSQMISIFFILTFLLLREVLFRFLVWNSEWEFYFHEIIFILMLITTTLTLVSGLSFLYQNRGVLSM